MNKPFGIQGKIYNFPFMDLQETFYDEGGIEIEIKNGEMIMGVDKENKFDMAKKLACLYLSNWTKRQNIKIDIDFNHHWKMNIHGGKDIIQEFRDTMKLIDQVRINTRTNQVNILGTARIVTQEMYNSASFTNDSLTVKKALKYPALKNALLHFSEEVVDDEKPLYGIYKALEAITHYIGGNGKQGRKNLAGLIGQSISYVDDIIQTTQTKRHNNTSATIKLNDIECKQRAKILIDAFSNSLP